MSTIDGERIYPSPTKLTKGKVIPNDGSMFLYLSFALLFTAAPSVMNTHFGIIFVG